MKKIFLILIVSVSVLLTACSSTASNTYKNQPTNACCTAPRPVTTNRSTTAQPSSLIHHRLLHTCNSNSLSLSPMHLHQLLPQILPCLPALDVIARQGYAMYDGFYIVGELLNNTAAPMGNIKITATYYYLRAGKPLSPRNHGRNYSVGCDSCLWHGAFCNWSLCIND